MARKLKARRRLGSELRRVVLQDVDNAVAALHEPAIDEDGVHAARKQLKHARATLRLAREKLGDARYRRENAALRDAGREIRAVRDAQTLVEAIDTLGDRFHGAIDPLVFAAARRSLIERERHLAKHLLRRAPAAAALALNAERDAIAAWSLGDGCKAAVRGLARTYERGVAARCVAIASPSPEHLHEWRKQAKHLGYQLRLFARAWRKRERALDERLDRLTDLLGEHHDLTLLRRMLPAGTEGLAPLIERRRRQVERNAFWLGYRLYGESCRKFARRIRASVDDWRRCTN